MQSSYGERQIYKEALENDFHFFVKQAVKILEPETDFKWNWHIEVICRYCEHLLEQMLFKAPNQSLQNLDINIPPRMMKTLIVSILFPAWVWTRYPWIKFLCASRSYGLATSFNIKRRDLIQSRFYQSMWPIEIKDDVNTTEKFANIYNGFMQSISALGKVTGEGADILLSDDLLDAMDAFSRVKRSAVNTWFSSAFYNRVQDKKKCIRININQRLHQLDVSGHIKENHPSFKRLIMPQQMTEKQLSDCGFVDERSPGEFLFPDRYGEKEKEDEYKSLGVYGYSGQHQQNPVPEGGGIIKAEWVRRYKTLPEFSRKIITADLAFKGESTSDWVCFQVWGRADSGKYLIDTVRGKWSYKVTKEKFKAFCLKHPDAGNKYIEDKANGPALISDLKEEVSGLVAWPRPGSKYKKADKVQRLYLVSEEYENGNVYVPEEGVMPDADAFIEELLSFTENGSTTGNDDMVDTSTMALLELKQSATFFVG